MKGEKSGAVDFVGELRSAQLACLHVKFGPIDSFCSWSARAKVDRAGFCKCERGKPEAGDGEEIGDARFFHGRGTIAQILQILLRYGVCGWTGKLGKLTPIIVVYDFDVNDIFFSILVDVATAGTTGTIAFAQVGTGAATATTELLTAAVCESLALRFRS